jgi:hypothetical protein
MGEAAWPADRIKMMALFFRNLQAHEYRSMRDPLAQKALLLYQSEQRKRWHLAVKTAVGAYDLSRINNELLERTRTRVYFDDREKKDNDRDYKVSFISTTILRQQPLKHGPFITFHAFLHRKNLNTVICHTPHATCHTSHATFHRLTNASTP